MNRKWCMLKPQQVKIALAVSIFICGFNYSFAQNYHNTSERSTTTQNLDGGQKLEDFFSAALAYSPKLKIASERLNVQKARRAIANSRLLPQVNGRASVSDNTRTASNIRQDFDGNRFSLQLTQTIFNWQAFAARSRAYLLEDAKEIEYYGELALLLTEVADRYFDALHAQDSLESVASELEAVKSQLQQIQQLYSRQLTQITDLYQAQASLAAVESQQIQLQSELVQKYEALRSISGVTVEQLYVLGEKKPLPQVEENLHFWVANAEENSHLIKIKELELEEATKAISQERGAFLPQVSLIIQRQDSDVGFDNRPIDRSDITYFGLDVSVPLYAGGNSSARIREAKSMREIAANELTQTRLEVTERVRTAYLQLRSSESITTAAQKLLDSTLLNTNAMRRGFELGAVTSVDVLNALREQYRAERDLQRVRYDHVKFLLTLKREAGILTAEDLIEVNGWLSLAKTD